VKALVFRPFFALMGIYKNVYKVEQLQQGKVKHSHLRIPCRSM